MMNLTTFAPDDFKEHLRTLDNKGKFNRARILCELDATTNHQHYVITGNDGVGKEDAVIDIFNRVASVAELERCVTMDATTMFDANGGFSESFAEIQEDNILLHIKHAEQLATRGNVNPKTGVEELCSMMSEKSNILVVLTGKRSQLLELVKGNEQARTYFSNIFHFDDLTPEALFQYMMEYVNCRNYQFDPDAETAFKEYLEFSYKLRGANFRNIYFLQDIFEKEILPKMSERVMKQDLPPEQMDLCTIMPEDLPVFQQPDTESAINRLKSLVGLEHVKKQILDLFSCKE